MSDYFSRENRLKRRDKRLSSIVKIADAITSFESKRLPKLSAQNAGVHAINLVREIFSQYVFPRQPKLGYSGIRHAKIDDDRNTIENGVITVHAEFKTHSGINIGVDVPIEIHDGSLLEPSIILHDGAPRIIAQSTFDNITQRNSTYGELPVRNLYGPPIDKSLSKDQYKHRVKIQTINTGMFSTASARDQIRKAIGLRKDADLTDPNNQPWLDQSTNGPKVLVKDRHNNPITTLMPTLKNNKYYQGYDSAIDTTATDITNIDPYRQTSLVYDNGASSPEGTYVPPATTVDPQDYKETVRYHTPKHFNGSTNILKITALTQEQRNEYPDIDRNHQDNDLLDAAERHQDDILPGMECKLTEEMEVRDRGGVVYNQVKGTNCDIIKDVAGDNKTFHVRFDSGLEAVVDRCFLKISGVSLQLRKLAQTDNLETIKTLLGEMGMDVSKMTPDQVKSVATKWSQYGKMLGEAMATETSAPPATETMSTDVPVNTNQEWQSQMPEETDKSSIVMPIITTLAENPPYQKAYGAFFDGLTQALQSGSKDSYMWVPKIKDVASHMSKTYPRLYSRLKNDLINVQKQLTPTSPKSTMWEKLKNFNKPVEPKAWESPSMRWDPSKGIQPSAKDEWKTVPEAPLVNKQNYQPRLPAKQLSMPQEYKNLQQFGGIPGALQSQSVLPEKDPRYEAFQEAQKAKELAREKTKRLRQMGGSVNPLNLSAWSLLTNSLNTAEYSGPGLKITAERVLTLNGSRINVKLANDDGSILDDQYVDNNSTHDAINQYLATIEAAKPTAPKPPKLPTIKAPKSPVVKKPTSKPDFKSLCVKCHGAPCTCKSKKKTKADINSKLAFQLTSIIRHEDGKWKVYTHDGSKLLGTHPTKEKAQAQLSAIEISKHSQMMTPGERDLIDNPGTPAGHPNDMPEMEIKADAELVAKVSEEVKSLKQDGMAEIDIKQAVKNKYGDQVLNAIFNKIS